MGYSRNGTTSVLSTVFKKINKISYRSFLGEEYRYLSFSSFLKFMKIVLGCMLAQPDLLMSNILIYMLKVSEI
jgi:hypothetical protein